MSAPDVTGHDCRPAPGEGRGRPRVLRNRHADPCTLAESGLADHCKGCLPCPEPHCRICSRVHAKGTCAECLAVVRESMHEIVRMVGDLPEEIEYIGTTDSEAMMLFGPATDAEAWGHRTASAAAGRIPQLDLDPHDAMHPLVVLGVWDMRWRDALDHDTAELVTVGRAYTYLDRNLTYMAAFEHLPFEDFADDVKSCRKHLEAVLHDGEQVDEGAPCMSCGTPLRRVWGKDNRADGWACPRCRRTSTEAQYQFAVQHLHREEAAWLTDHDMEIRTGVKAGTVRVWAQRGHVKRKRDSGRTLFDVVDVLEYARDRGLVS